MARWQIQTLTEAPGVFGTVPDATQLHGTVEITSTVVTQYQALAVGLNIVAAPVTSVDRWGGSLPDRLFSRPPNNVGDAFFWDPNTTFPERAQIDKFAPLQPDLFLRVRPINVGDSLFWGELETAPEPEIGYSYGPDLLFRRPPNNMGPDFMPFITTIFTERVQLDKFSPIYRDYLFRKPPINVGDSLFWDPNVNFPELVSVDRWIGSRPDYLFRASPLRWHDMFFWDPAGTNFPEAVTVDRWIGQKPDYIFRRAPNNVGEPFAWDNVQLVPPFIMQAFVSYPDVLFRRPPNNVGDAFFQDPNVNFPETVSADRFMGQKPDYLWRIRPIGVGDSFFWGIFTPASFTPLNLASYPDYINRRPPNNVGDAQFWGELETAPEPEIGYAYYPDYLFRRASNNVGEPLSWDPNIRFAEVISADKWLPTYPVYVWRLPRLTEYPALAFWGINTPSVVASTTQLLFDIDHKRFFIQVTKPASGPPYIRPI